MEFKIVAMHLTSVIIPFVGTEESDLKKLLQP